jgi:hypothetical protein
MTIGMNNRAEMVLRCLHVGVKAKGCPSRVRGDRGGENVMVAAWMEFMRGPDHNAYIWGV